MRRTFALLVCVITTMALCFTGCAATGVSNAHTIESKTFAITLPEWLQDVDSATDDSDGEEQEQDSMDDELPLYFVDGIADIPYVSVEDWTELVQPILPVEFSLEGDKATLTRTDSGYTMVIDAQDDTITYVDYDAFLQKKDDIMLISVLTGSKLPEDSQDILAATKKTYNRYGKEVVFRLGDYEIDAIVQDGLCLLPLQTMNDVLMSHISMLSLSFNGEALTLTQDPLSKYSAGAKELSEELAAFNYHEMCLMLDNFYGLKESHYITSFDKLFDEIGLKQDLMSTDPNTVDTAIAKFIAQDLDDVHSSFLSSSSYVGEDRSDELYDTVGDGSAHYANDLDELRYKTARSVLFPDGVPFYQEIGDTAFVTFDGFGREREDYYEEATLDDPIDTLEIIMHAHEQITRKGSPVKNVVLDLSCNTGGAADAAVFTAAWFLGSCPFAQRNTLSDALSVGVFKADVNRDHKFDKNDTVRDRNLYCIISPVSFSSGNLVPAALKSSGQVTLLGRPTGGGACVVAPSSNAIGTTFNISGNMQCSITKNGSFYNVDEGVEPDVTLTQLASYYDRPALVEYIKGLM